MYLIEQLEVKLFSMHEHAYDSDTDFIGALAMEGCAMLSELIVADILK